MMKQECAPSVTLGTFTGSLVGLIEQLRMEHHTFLAKTAANLFPARQVFTKRIWDKIQSVDDHILQLSVVVTTVLSKQNAVQTEWEYKVPNKLIVATPALRKKTSSIRGTAGVTRKHLLKELAKAKTKSKTRLTYMDRPAPRPEPGRTRPRPDAH